MMTHQVYGEIMSPFNLDIILIEVLFCILSFERKLYIESLNFLVRKHLQLIFIVNEFIMAKLLHLRYGLCNTNRKSI